jgi:ribosomal protein L11 methylase PrmA
VEGVEIDPMAIDSAYRNAAMNTLSMPFYVPVDRDGEYAAHRIVSKAGIGPLKAATERDPLLVSHFHMRST